MSTDRPREGATQNATYGHRWFRLYTAWQPATVGGAVRYQVCDALECRWDRTLQAWVATTRHRTLYDPLLASKAGVGDLVRAFPSAPNKRWEVVSTGADALIVEITDYLPPIYSAAGEQWGTYGDAGFRLRAINCTVWQVADDPNSSAADTWRLTETQYTVKVVNWTSMPAYGFQRVDRIADGLYALKHNSTENDAYFQWSGAASSSDWANNGEWKLARGTVSVGTAAGAIGITSNNFAFRNDPDVFVRFPGRYMITYGATISRGQGEISYTTATGPESAGTAHTHNYEAPGFITAKIGLLAPKLAPGALVDNDFADSFDNIMIGQGTNNPTISVEKTFSYNFEADNADNIRWFRIGVGLKCTHIGSYTNNSTTNVKLKVSKAWIRIRHHWMHPFDDDDQFGTNEYVNGFPGAIQWWGDTTQPRLIDVNGADAGVAP